MDLKLKGLSALVTGASRGLGFATALGLVKEGVRVAISSRSAENIEAAAQKISTQTGVQVVGLNGDMTDPEMPEKLVAGIVEKFDGLDILITNAGGPPPGAFESFDEETWQKAVDISFLGHVRLIRAALPHMQATNWGRIINITSLSVKEPVDNLLLSNSIRASVHGLAKTLASQIAKDGITVNNVMPGYIQTDRIDQLAAVRAEQSGTTAEAIIADMGASVPVGRIGQPKEFGALVAFLASEKAGYINGASIPIDGSIIKAAF